MRKTRRNSILRFTFLFVALSLLTTSIVLAETFTPLKKDKLRNSKSSSIIFGRVKMTSRVENFNKVVGKNFAFTGIRKSDQYKYIMTVSIKTRSDRWEGDGEWGYDSFFAMGVPPGDYSFQTLTYNFGYFFLNDPIHNTKGYITQLTTNFKETQSVEAGKLIYFGTINISYNSFELYDRYQFSFDYDLKVANDFDNDLEKFKTAYPQLYEQFKDNIVTASFVKQ